MYSGPASLLLRRQTGELKIKIKNLRAIFGTLFDKCREMWFYTLNGGGIYMLIRIEKIVKKTCKAGILWKM